MVGRDIGALFPKTVAEIGDAVLKVDGLSRAGVFRDISFEVRAGEIVALAGLVGAGRTEVARAVFGIDPYDAGEITFERKQAQATRSPGGHHRRHGLRPGGPPQAGPGHGPVRGPQRHAHAAQQAARRRG